MSKNAAFETVVKLKYPIKVGEEEITEIGLNRPKAKHIRKFGRGLNMGDLLDLAAACSDYAPPVIDRLDAFDAMALSEAVGNFLDDGRETGNAE